MSIQLLITWLAQQRSDCFAYRGLIMPPICLLHILFAHCLGGRQLSGSWIHPSNLILTLYEDDDELDGRWVENDSILLSHHPPNNCAAGLTPNLLLLLARPGGKINQAHTHQTGYLLSERVTRGLMFGWDAVSFSIFSDMDIDITFQIPFKPI